MRFLLKLVVQSLNHVHLFAASSTVACQVPLSSTISQSLLKFTSTELVVQSLGHVWLFETPRTAACQVSLSFIISWSLLKLLSMTWWCYRLLLCLLAFPASESFPVSQLFILSGESIGDSASHSLSNEYSGLISFRIDRFDHLAIQETLESSPAPWFESINSSVLSHPHGLTLISLYDCWKNHSFDYMDLCQQSGISAF